MNRTRKSAQSAFRLAAVKMLDLVLSNRLSPVAVLIVDGLIRAKNFWSIFALYMTSREIRETVVERLKLTPKRDAFWGEFTDDVEYVEGYKRDWLAPSNRFDAEFIYDFVDYFDWNRTSVYNLFYLADLRIEQFMSCVNWSAVTRSLYTNRFDFVYKYREQLIWSENPLIGYDLPKTRSNS